VAARKPGKVTVVKCWPVEKINEIPKGWKLVGTLGHHTRWSVLIEKVE
jgi:uncharacterized protein YbdZ (MbtH family)